MSSGNNKSVQSAQPVVSRHPSDISRLKKFVPLSPARCITLAPANIVRKDSGEIRKFAYAIKQTEKGRETEKYTSRAAKVYFPRPASILPENEGRGTPNSRRWLIRPRQARQQRLKQAGR